MSKAKADRFQIKVAMTEFADAIQRVCEVTERRNTIPILGTVRIAAGADGIALTCTDLDVEMHTTVPGEGQGTVCVPVRRLRGLLDALSHVENLVMDSGDGSVVRLRAPGFLATMIGMAPDDFPEITPLGTPTLSASLAEGVFRFLIGGVAHAISTDATRYYLNGAALEIRNGALIAIATDGHRLATRESTLVCDTPDLAPIIIPRKAVVMALGLDEAGEVEIVADQSRIELTFPHARLRAKLIDGTFPDWRRVIPAASPATIVVETGMLRRAIRLARANSPDRARAAAIEGDAGALKLTSNDGEGCTVEMTVEAFVDPLFRKVGLNARYLDEVAVAMQRIGSKTLRMEARDGSAPLRIMPDEAIRGALNVLMPMRI